MRASVLFEQGKPLSIEELELEPPRVGEVLVRMAASGVCHSCLHAADGSWKGVPVPIVLGDEGAGVVEEIGPGVDTLKVGDHVILSWAPTCGRCHYCVIGRPNLCERRLAGRGVLPDGTTRMSLGGRPVHHYGHVATYASRTVVHESSAIAIDAAMPHRSEGETRADVARRYDEEHGLTVAPLHADRELHRQEFLEHQVPPRLIAHRKTLGKMHLPQRPRARHLVQFGR